MMPRAALVTGIALASLAARTASADPATPAEVAPASVPEAPSPRRAVTVLDGVALLGVLPSPTFALAAGFGVGVVPRFDLRFGGLLSGVGTTGFQGGSVRGTLLAARADGCGVAPGGVLRGCLGFLAGRYHLATEQPSPFGSRSFPWAAAAGRVEVGVALASWLRLVFGGDAILPVTRPQLEVVTPAGATVTSNRPPVLGGAVSFGAEFTFR